MPDSAQISEQFHHCCDQSSVQPNTFHMYSMIICIRIDYIQGNNVMIFS